MNTRVILKKSTYRDSISLMKISNSISKLPGITQAAVVMATSLTVEFSQRLDLWMHPLHQPRRAT